jgi:hypothetical protein
MSSKNFNPEELSIAELVKNKAAIGKRTLSATKSTSNFKSRNLVKPVKSLFEGRSIEEALPRRNSDSSVSSHHIRRILDDDDVSVSSVQNLETIPSVSESVGILSIISSNFRKNRSVTEKHIAELPNKRKLQSDTTNLPVVMMDIQQSSGVYVTPSADGSAHSDDNGNSRSQHTDKSFRCSLSSPNGGNGPKRKDSLGLFRGASLRNLIQQADSNHRRMMALEDSEHDNSADLSVMGNDNRNADTSASVRNTAPNSIPEEMDVHGTHVDNNIKRKESSRRPKRNPSTSSAADDAELEKAKNRMRGTRRKNGKTNGDCSTPQRSKSGEEKSAGTSSTTSSLETENPAPEEASHLNDSFAWVPIVQSHAFLSSLSSGMKLSFDDTDSQRGYSSDSSEHFHKSRARWHMSREGQQVDERIRQQNYSLAETLAESANLPLEDDVDKDVKTGHKESELKETKRLEGEWHYASRDAMKSNKHTRDLTHADEQYSSGTGQRNLFRGRNLRDALPENTRNDDRDKLDRETSVPSLTSIAIEKEEGSLMSDTFSKQHTCKVTREVLKDEDCHTPTVDGALRCDPRASILREYKLRHLETLDLEQSNHDASKIPAMRTYEWESVAARDYHVGELERDDKLYPSTMKTTPVSKPEFRVSESLQKSEHSESSSMGESHIMEKASDDNLVGIVESLLKKAAIAESSNKVNQSVPQSQHESNNDLKCVEREAKQAIMAALGGDDPQKESDGYDAFGWQRILDNADRLDDKRYSSEEISQSLPQNKSSNNAIESHDEYKKEMKVPTIWLPPVEWQHVEIGRKDEHLCYPEDLKKSTKNVGNAKAKIIKGSPIHASPTKKRSGKSSKSQLKKNSTGEGEKANVSLNLTTCKDKIASEIGPFAKRSCVARPLVTRPKGTLDFSSEVVNRSNFSTSSSADEISPEEIKTMASIDDDDDDKSTQSVDRNLVRESSHRRLLRKQVADRRESLQTIILATKRNSISEEDDLLSLKRKLALSQALVQKLEIENVEIRRQSVLAVSRAQLKLLEQRDNREEELENRLKLIMQERNAAVEECHQLRILIMSTCDMCRRHFNENKQYFMDQSQRNTVLSKQKYSKLSVFEWLNDNLWTEALAMNTNDTSRSARIVDNETCSLEGTTKTADTASFHATPLLWLSEKLFNNQYECGIRLPKEKLSLDSVIVEHVDNQESGAKTPGDSLCCKPDLKDSVPTAVHADHSLAAVSCGISRDKAPEDKSFQTLGDSLCCKPDLKDAVPTAVHADHSSAAVSCGSSRAKAPEDKSFPPKFLKRSFFGSLLGEKVDDELSSLTMPVHREHKTETSKGFSFFGGLKREEVEEDAVFWGIDKSLSVISEGKESPLEKKKKGFGLKDEQVLDDMELFHSLQQVSSRSCNANANNAKTKTGLGFKDEQVQEDLLDAGILNMAISPKEGSLRNACETKNHLSLLGKKIDVNKYDDQLLSLLNQRSPIQPAGKANTTSLRDETVDEDSHDGALSSSHGLLSPRKNAMASTAQQSNDGSNLSSPLSWKQNHRKFNKEDLTVPKYLDKFRSPSPSPKKGLRDVNGLSPTDLQATRIGISNADGINHSSPLPDDGKGLDPEERPWRTKAVANQKMEPRNRLESKPEKTNDKEEAIASADKIDQVASLIEKENNTWEQGEINQREI